MKKPHVLVTHWVHPEVIDFLEQHAHVTANQTRLSWPRDVVQRIAADSDALMAFMPDSIDEAFLAACPRLRIVSAALKGADNFDIAACTRRGVWFSVVPDLLTVPTAELALGLMIALGRKLLAGDDHVRSGDFAGWRPMLYGTGLHGRTLGLIGLGAVGRAIAERATAFGMRVLYTDPNVVHVAHQRASLEQILAQSDYVLPLMHLTRETHHLVDARALAQMKRGAKLVNVGRGGLVDEHAVAQALASGHLGGYAADVFEMEDWAWPGRPRTIPDALLDDRQRTIFTPHLGSAVDEVRLAIAREAAENIVEALQGRRPRGAVNEPMASAVAA